MHADGCRLPGGAASSVVKLGCLLLLAWAAAFPAHAQVHPCAGPGPGEVMVGEQPASNGVAAIPLCQYVDNGSYQQAAPPPPPVHLPDTYMAVILHPDTTALWITTGYPSDASAKQAAMDACTKAMGEGCSVGEAWSNLATVVVVEDVAGNLYGHGDTDPDAARQRTMLECQQYSTGCQVSRVIVNAGFGKADQFPTQIPARRLFASVARPKGTPPEKWDDAAWLASGQSGYKAAEDAALTQCEHDTGMACQIRVTVGNGFIVRALDDQSAISWLNASSRDMIQRTVIQGCPQGRQCRLVDSIDARTPRQAVIYVSVSESPARGFFSLARPVDDAAEKTWDKRALVTGKASVAEAQAAAVALCEEQSKSHCEAMPTKGDEGVDQFLLLLRDGAGAPLAFYGASAENARSRKNASCAKDHSTCPDGVFVDLATPVKTIVSF